MELYQIKRELITDFLKQKMPITVNTKKPLSWWLDQNFARKEDLELVTE